MVHHLLALDLDLLFPLDQRPLADAAVFGLRLLLLAPLAQPIEGRADAVGQRQPGKPQCQRHAGHQRSDPQHTRTGKAEPVRGQRPESEAEHAAGMAGKPRLPLVEPGPLQRGAGCHQQHKADPECRARHGLRHCNRHLVAAHGIRQARQPRARADRHQPPDRIAEQEQTQVGQPRADDARLVAQRRTVAGGRETRVAEVVGGQRQQQQQPEHRAGDEHRLVAPARRGQIVCRGGRVGLRRMLAARVSAACRAAFSAQGTERKCHGRDCGRSGGGIGRSPPLPVRKHAACRPTSVSFSQSACMRPGRLRHETGRRSCFVSFSRSAGVP